jgi:hypothetical protein
MSGTHAARRRCEIARAQRLNGGVYSVGSCTGARIREHCRQEIARLPTTRQLAAECGCSVALVRLIAAGYQYAAERDASE